MKIQAIPNRPWKKVGNDLSTANHTNSLIITGCSIDFWEPTDFLDLELLRIEKQNIWAEMEYQTVQFNIMDFSVITTGLYNLPKKRN